MPCEVAVRWAVSEEDHVQLIIKDETFEVAQKQARDFLAVIREERLTYNQQVMQPLMDKRDELEAALVDKQRQLKALEDQCTLLRSSAHLPNGAPFDGLG
jgi:hypothetical protein